MEYRPLNLTLISADGLKDVKLFSKMDLYAEVWIAGVPQSKKKTFIDKDCGKNPKWNFKMEFILDEPYLTKPGHSLIFMIKDESTFGSDKEVGSVNVPIHDLFKQDKDTEERIVEYQVQTPSGKPKGTLKFSYKFGEKFTQQAKVETKRHADDPVTAYPPTAHPPPAAYPPQAAYPQQASYPPAAYPAGGGYGAPPPGMGYPPPQYAPPPAAGYSAYPQASGYGYQAPPGAYGYPPAGYAPYAQPQQPNKNKMGGMAGVGLGLGAGLLGGLLVGEIASDIGDSSSYADGYGDAMDDMGDF